MHYIMSTIALVYRLTFQAVFSISPLELPGFVMNSRKPYQYATAIAIAINYTHLED